MSLFDRLRPKWRHSDPIVREQGVRALQDQAILARVAMDEHVEAVRLAAIEKLTDQRVLGQLACGPEWIAPAAIKRLTDHAQINTVALSAERADVRHLAVDRIDDSVLLHRIATSDTDPWIRAKARDKRMGPDQKRDFIRGELSKLRLAQNKAKDVAEICGSLEDMCSALTGNGPFRVNGGVAAQELESNRESTSTKHAQEVDCAQFLAFKGEPATRSAETATTHVFYEIMVWRTENDTFACRADEKRRTVVQDAARWSRVSNGPAGSTQSESSRTPAPNRTE